MIPKKIHYCWFGGAKKSKIAKKCIRSWKKKCPDYEIIEWNESNYDTTKLPYMKEAYESKKWGFVTDYVRLDVIYNHGGIYLDTDVEVIKSFDSLLRYSGFAGFESDEYIATGLGIGAEKGNPIVKAVMDSYNGIHFLKEDGSYDLTPCPVSNSIVFEKCGFRLDGTVQNINNFVLLPRDYLNPVDNHTNGVIHKTKNTLSIHHFAASWLSDDERRAIAKSWKKCRRTARKSIVKDKIKYFLQRFVILLFGKKNYMRLRKKLKKD